MRNNKSITVSFLESALKDPLWINHKIGNEYKMDNDFVKISYYPIFECGKTGKKYDEPRALVEKPIFGKLGMIIGTDFREVPLRYLTLKINI